MMSLRSFKRRHLLTLLDYAPSEIVRILEVSREMKRLYYAGMRSLDVLRGRTLMLIFEKPSTRTRVSLEVAALELGMNVIYSNPSELQLGRGEPIKDTIRVLSRYVDAVAARVFRHESLEEMARYGTIPIINALSDKYHPLQALADALTIWEIKGKLKDVKLAFIGDGNCNVARSLIVIGAKLGWEVRIVGPRRYWPDEKLLKEVQEDLKRSGGNIVMTEDLEHGVKNVDVVYTDVWVSMGFESETEQRIRELGKYQVNMNVMKIAGDDAVFMHCLPAKRGQEVTDDVLESSRSVVWDQAENRLHTAKAVLALLLS
ncbi:MAG: ornithine carbamoyltransferase [Crenarchaeota archaeon]|nr:ornithine carbamoyltransferase [Thermoproteota archaeon]